MTQGWPHQGQPWDSCWGPSERGLRLSAGLATLVEWNPEMPVIIFNTLGRGLIENKSNTEEGRAEGG